MSPARDAVAGSAAHIPPVHADDLDEWMARFPLTDAEAELLLCGTAPSGRQELAPLAQAFASLRERVRRAAPPAMSLALLAQLRAPAGGALEPRALIRRGVAWVSAAAVAAFALVGVGASQNVLPAGMQDAISSTADIIGIELPTAAERDDDEGGEPAAAGSRRSDKSQGPDVPPGPAATPADPGTPGDQEPATPAVPPEHSSGGNASATGQPVDPGAPAAEAAVPDGENDDTGTPETADDVDVDVDVDTGDGGDEADPGPPSTVPSGNADGSAGPPAGESGSVNGGEAAERGAVGTTRAAEGGRVDRGEAAEGGRVDRGEAAERDPVRERPAAARQ